MNKRIMALVVLLAALAGGAQGKNWQAVGTLDPDNITIIWDYINQHFQTALTNPSDPTNHEGLSSFSDAFSTYLNGLWAEAWNVVVIYSPDGSNTDSILYGYAYRAHWFWYNGFRTSDGNYAAIVLWKDYNCAGWLTFEASKSAFFIDPPDDSSNYESIKTITDIASQVTTATTTAMTNGFGSTFVTKVTDLAMAMVDFPGSNEAGPINDQTNILSGWLAETIKPQVKAALGNSDVFGKTTNADELDSIFNGIAVAAAVNLAYDIVTNLTNSLHPDSDASQVANTVAGQALSQVITVPIAEIVAYVTQEAVMECSSSDIWVIGHTFVEKLVSVAAAYQVDQAYSIVISENRNAMYFAKTCAKSTYHPVLATALTDCTQKSFLLLRMR